MQGQKYREYLAPILVISVLILIIPIFFLLPRDLAKSIIAENGFIENATVLLYFINVAISLILAKKKTLCAGYSIGLILLLFAFRELDFHVRFTTMGIFKARFFSSDMVPLKEKIIVTIIFLLVLVLLIKVIRNNWHSFITAIKNKKTWVISFLCGVILLPVSKIIDGFPRVIKEETGLKLANDIRFICSILEESLELAIPLFFLIAFYQWSKRN